LLWCFYLGSLGKNMFNFANCVVYSLFSLGFGYNVGKPDQFALIKFLCSVLFFILIADNLQYLLPMGIAFIFGMIYSKGHLFGGFFDFFGRIKERRNASKENKKRKKQESHYQAEQAQQAKDHEQRRRAEELRRAEEARRQRKAEEVRKEGKAEKQKADDSPKDRRSPQEVLGLKSGFTQDELKEAYKRESNRSHPDKWVGKPDHIKAMMAEEQKLINWAYNQLK